MSLLGEADRSTFKPWWTEAAPAVFTPVLVSTVVSERLTSQSPAGAGAGRWWWQGGMPGEGFGVGEGVSTQLV